MENGLVNEIVKKSLRAVWDVGASVRELIKDNPQNAFDPYHSAVTGKCFLNIDKYSEDTFRVLTRKYFRDKITYYGEESFRNPSLDLAAKVNDDIVAIMDMVDGTDLVVRNLSNWCSAVVFFSTKEEKILASLVGFPSRRVYCYCPSFNKGAFYVQKLGTSKGLTSEVTYLEDLNGKSKDLMNSTICFYGQKLKKLLSFQRFIENLNKQDLDSNIRVYNLGGNPMMVKVATGEVDAVIELEGQFPHDVAAGAYIAKSTGAVFRDLEGREINLAKLLLKPAHPDSKIKYILASSEKLYQDIRQAIQ